MTREVLLRVLACTGLLLPGCGAGDGASANGDQGTDSGTTDTSGTGGTGDDGGVTTTAEDTGSNGEDSSDGAFIGEPDGGSTDACDIWAQDCPEGEKCMPWANDGGNSWNATKCTPIDPNPKQPGDPCTVEGSVTSGVDDCDLGSMCFFANEQTLEGICVPFCIGSPLDPKCEDPDATCGIYNDGVMILCLTLCDPLLQDCPDGQGCYLGPEEFQCVPAGSGAHRDECECFLCCSPGLYCVSADIVPGCPGAIGCCTPFCDVTEPNTCPGMAEGEECVPIGEQPEYEHVGVCAIP